MIDPIRGAMPIIAHRTSLRGYTTGRQVFNPKAVARTASDRSPNAVVEYVDADTGAVLATDQYYDPALEPRR